MIFCTQSFALDFSKSLILNDLYQTIETISEGKYTEKGSKFLAFAYPISEEDAVKEYIQNLRKAHPKARHVCFAFRIGTDGNRFRANDDGEPAATAGKPILGQIDSFELTNVLVAVVRYFGGTKLGTSGLINAYRTATADALRAASIIERTVNSLYELTFDYAYLSDFMAFLKQQPIDIVTQDFAEQPTLTLAIRKSETPRFLTNFDEYFKIVHPKVAFELRFKGVR